ncbi:protocatechuate 3,4-dioxygenase subunit alpha [Sulfitobacter delicatus]|uniref:Protocatechuate 3,4-dioxygenase, alpha subunit n=1 Tax=Sulfitobacter delicatus TaxID=218672 RepID=A0A1G7PE30_9RHOB|nr:protocatechuate 3,4-dioxygenase subunit alpha [Sulfitobacter delicatus]SDF84543.1 protocatechuate 3,4-dioxygenase, alpha subunit [Sulfitobacter delicatus]
MSKHPETASQTAGPYVHIGCTPNFAGLTGLYENDLGADMATDKAQGARITLSGRIFDGAGDLIHDALVEAWQADAAGRHAGQPGADPHFSGFGRCPCDAETGEFRFKTVKPGPVAWPQGGQQAPHITLWIVARGINIGLHTRVYFADEDVANAQDPVLAEIADNRAATLLARPQSAGDYRLDIHLQGPNETVFFAV